MATAKEEVEELLVKLPNDCSLEDIQYHLYVLEELPETDWNPQRPKGPFRSKKPKRG